MLTNVTHKMLKLQVVVSPDHCPRMAIYMAMFETHNKHNNLINLSFNCSFEMAPSFDDDNSLFNFVVKEGNGVKGLVDLGLTKVPGRYIQPPHRRINKQEVAGSLEIVTIDLSELDGPNHEQVVKAIVHASETLGFFQVVNHGVPLEVLESLKVTAHQFFGQPAEKKAVL
ncbi:putative non-hem dioxygenase domain, isopenicillin N synthase [Helianthus debilis subsp. tardiflorus]